MSSSTAAVVVAAISAAVSFGTAITSEVMRRRSAARLDELAHSREVSDKAEEAQQLVARYRDPLLRSAFDLQSRIYNVLRRGFRGSRDPEYLRLNTLFVIAEFLGWLEIVRREMQFLDLGEVDATRQLSRRLNDIQNCWATSRWRDDFYIYRGQQRAIGELMIARLESSSRAGPQSECIGYASFVAKQGDPQFAQWFERLGEAIATLPGTRPPRLATVQNHLIDLIEFLDPSAIRFPESRDRLPV